MIYVIGALLLGIPILSVIYFAVSLYDFIRAKKTNTKEPDTHTAAEMKKYKINLVVSAVIMAVLLSVVIAFVVMMYLAIAYM